LFGYSNVASPQREKLFAKIASFSKWRITSHKIGQISSPDKKSKSVSDQVVRNIKLSESSVGGMMTGAKRRIIFCLSPSTSSSTLSLLSSSPFLSKLSFVSRLIIVGFK